MLPLDFHYLFMDLISLLLNDSYSFSLLMQKNHYYSLPCFTDQFFVQLLLILKSKSRSSPYPLLPLWQ